MMFSTSDAYTDMRLCKESLACRVAVPVYLIMVKSANAAQGWRYDQSICNTQHEANKMCLSY